MCTILPRVVVEETAGVVRCCRRHFNSMERRLSLSGAAAAFLLGDAFCEYKSDPKRAGLNGS